MDATQSMAQPSPFVDHALNILSGTDAVDDSTKADLYDAFHNSKDSNELAAALQPLAAPDEVKAQLHQAKQLTDSAPSPVAKAAEALTAMSQLDPKILAIAENHPKLASAFISAATKGSEKASEPGAAGQKDKADQKTPEVQKAAKTAPPARPDGLPPLPAIPEGHYRILASDGGIHDVPAEGIEKARQIDPNLHIMNP